MDTWATSSLTPADRRRLGATTPTCSPARSRWTCGRRVPRSSAPGCSTPSCARTSSTTRCRGPTRRSTAGSSTPTARRCRRARATWSRRWPLLEQHGADAVRYWAASGRPGTDTAVDEGQMKVGRRLAIKLLNASKFALGVIGDDGPDRRRDHRAARPVDARGARRRSSPTPPRRSTAYDYARALERTERFFWGFCDDYLELVKHRAYGTVGRRRGSRAALRVRARHAAAPVRAAPAVT